jgi:hypothetical protein
MSHLHVLLKEGFVHGPVLHIKRVLLKQWAYPIGLRDLVKEQDLIVGIWPVEMEILAKCGGEVAC